MKRIVQIADLHMRPLSRVAENKQHYEIFFTQLRNDVKPDHIVVCGDIVNNRTEVSPEQFDLLAWFFNECATIGNTHIILGNHDANLASKDRMDAITPVVNALNNSKIHLYKQSGVYEFAPNYNFCVYSITDKLNWNKVEPVKGATNICLFHGGVVGGKNDDGFMLDSDTEPSFFNKYDIVMLGDYHLRQHLGFKDVEIEIDDSELSLYPDAIILEK